MKQIKAFVHHNRAADLLHALEAGGFTRLSLFPVRGMLPASNASEMRYSVEFGDGLINEVQLELFCEDADVARAVEIFRSMGRAGRAGAGWIYVSAIEQAFPIDGGD